VERRKLAHCYQIANHMKDIYADDITLSVAPADKLLGFLESTLAAAVADRPEVSGTAPAGHGRCRPEITAVNAAFALALVERHDIAGPGHRIYDLARAAGSDTDAVDVDAFRSGSSRSAPTPPRATTGRRSSRPLARTPFESQKRAESRFRIVSMNDGVDRPRRPLINRNAVGARACERHRARRAHARSSRLGLWRCSWSVR